MTPLESKRMYFQNYGYAVRRGAEKMYHASVAVLTDLENIKIKQKQQEERIIYSSGKSIFLSNGSGLYFCRRLKSTG